MATQPQPLPTPIDRVQGGIFCASRGSTASWTCTEIRPLVEQASAEAANEIVVRDSCRRCSVNLLVGDSGIGKSPLAYQLGLAAAVGLPFLGMATRASKVLLVDYGEFAWPRLTRSWSSSGDILGISEFPATFQLWSACNSARSRSRWKT